MLPLAEFQRAFAHAVMKSGAIPDKTQGRLLPDEAMRIHRNTVMGALAGALRLSHPTVGELVGEAFFDQMAVAFAEAQPPRTASLSRYGEGFAIFLEDHAPGLPYLGDVARLDYAIERALQAETGMQQFSLDPSVRMILPKSLTVLALQYPADEIRAAIGDDKALERISLRPTERYLLVWRQDARARLRPAGNLAGQFLRALLSGATAQVALETVQGDQSDTLTQLQADIFAAPFCTIISNPEGFQPCPP